MLFLQEEKIDGKFKQSLRIIKLDFDQFFVQEEDGEERDFSGENIKNCVTSHEVRTIDFIEGPLLLDGHNYIGFQDIGYNITTVNKRTGIQKFSF